MSTKRKIDIEKFESLDISNKPQCDCGCQKCQIENQFLREKLIELYNILERKITRQSLNTSLNSSFSGLKNSAKQTSTKGCNCKKSCSTRCGCFKKDFFCGKHCKCDKISCKNQVQVEPDENNAENHNVSINSINQEPLSPITKREIKKNIPQNENLVPTINVLNDKNEQQDENFDPMKPRHQLPRSPILIKNGLSVHDNSVLNDPEPCSFPLLSVSNVDISLANASIKSMANDLPEELQQPIVDWEKHKAELKQCPKCKRKFHPNRLSKHKAICKGI